MSDYPFPLPAAMMQRLPPSAKDGKHYLDVRVAGKWDGIIVLDKNGMYLGVFVRGRIEEFPFPFDPGAIEDIRVACLSNRLLAAVPFDAFDGAVLTVLFFSPIALGLGLFVSPWFALISLVTCMVAIYIMYQAPGFPFVRFPAAMLGMAQILSAGVTLLRLFF